MGELQVGAELIASLGRLFGGDLAVLKHGIDHQIAALESVVRCVIGE